MNNRRKPAPAPSNWFTTTGVCSNCQTSAAFCGPPFWMRLFIHCLLYTCAQMDTCGGYLWWILVVDTEATSHPALPSVRHTDEAQHGRNSCLWLFHLCGMTGEAITGCHKYRTAVPLTRNQFVLTWPGLA